jgi:ADP-ribose pyrophosphatase YjhB (NUDIX family)
MTIEDLKSPLDPVRTTALVQELGALAEAGLGIPSMPFPILSALKSLAPLPTAELCIYDESGSVLLTWRDDKYWHGWHFPGGFIAPGESLAEACDRIARRELGAGFQLAGVAGIECWKRHPYASVVALLCRGKLLEEPTQGRYFTEPPAELLAEQVAYFTSLRSGTIVYVDRMREKNS